MTESHWTWAELDDDQLMAVADTERSIHAGYVVVYRPATGPYDRPVALDLPAEPLDAGQLQRIRSLEEQVDGVAVAYRRL